jgi:hypothetical protein
MQFFAVSVSVRFAVERSEWQRHLDLLLCFECLFKDCKLKRIEGAVFRGCSGMEYCVMGKKSVLLRIGREAFEKYSIFRGGWGELGRTVSGTAVPCRG